MNEIIIHTKNATLGVDFELVGSCSTLPVCQISLTAVAKRNPTDWNDGHLFQLFIPSLQ